MEGTETTTETEVEVEIDKPNSDDAKKLKAENERMKKALADQQKRNQELETFKKEQERAKLSEQERLAAEKKELAEELEKHKIEVAAARAELEQQRLINKLVAEGLEDDEFGPVLLKKYKPDEQSWDDFVKAVKADKKHGKLFASSRSEPSERPVAPAAPNSGSSRGNKTDGPTDADKEMAKKLYPKDENLQAAFLRNLKEADKKRRERVTED